jgi:hypothetical protein
MKQAMRIACFAYPSNLKIEATCSSETPADFQWTIWGYIPEDRTLHNAGCENFKSYIPALEVSEAFKTQGIGVKADRQYWILLIRPGARGSVVG